MNIDVTGRHFHVTDALRAHALEKLKKLEKYAVPILSAHVLFDIQKINHNCEIVLSGKNLRMTAKEATADMYASFDGALANLLKQLARHHEKLVTHRGWRSKHVPVDRAREKEEGA